MGGHELNGALSLVEEDVQADAQLSLTVPTLSAVKWVKMEDVPTQQSLLQSATEPALIAGRVEVSGAGWSKANGVYTLCLPSISKDGRTWKKQDGSEEWWIGAWDKGRCVIFEGARGGTFKEKAKPINSSRDSSTRYTALYSGSEPHDGLWPAREGWELIAGYRRPPSPETPIVTPMLGHPKNFSDDLEAFRAGVRDHDWQSPITSSKKRQNETNRLRGCRGTAANIQARS